MFGKKDDRMQITTILGRGSELTGGFSSPGSVKIDGVVRGDIVVTGGLILGPEGKIYGDILASRAEIAGFVKGDLTARDRVELLGSAKVYGDITTSRINIDEQAVFQGRCSTGPREEEEEDSMLTKEILLAEKERAAAGLPEEPLSV